MRNQVNRKMTTAQLARVMAYQGQRTAILKALATEAASWPTGAWSADTETRLQEKRAAANGLWGDQSRAADDYGHRLRAEQQLRDKLGFVDALLRRLVK